MFSKENRRFTTVILASLLVGMGTMALVGGIVWSDQDLPAAERTTTGTLGVIVGLGVALVLHFLGVLKTNAIHQTVEQHKTDAEAHRQRVIEKVESIEQKVNGNLERARDDATAAREQASALPKTADELEALIERVVKRTCDQTRQDPPASVPPPEQQA